MPLQKFIEKNLGRLAMLLLTLNLLIELNTGKGILSFLQVTLY